MSPFPSDVGVLVNFYLFFLYEPSIRLPPLSHLSLKSCIPLPSLFAPFPPAKSSGPSCSDCFTGSPVTGCLCMCVLCGTSSWLSLISSPVLRPWQTRTDNRRHVDMLLSITYVAVVSVLQHVPHETMKLISCAVDRALLLLHSSVIFSVMCSLSAWCVYSKKLCSLTYCSAVKHASSVCVCICRCSDLHMDRLHCLSVLRACLNALECASDENINVFSPASSGILSHWRFISTLLNVSLRNKRVCLHPKSMNSTMM